MHEASSLRLVSKLVKPKPRLSTEQETTLDLGQNLIDQLVDSAGKTDAVLKLVVKID